MSWNQSGDNKPKDPWADGGKTPQQPPELDKMLKEVKQRFTSFLGGKKPQGGGGRASLPWYRLLVLLIVGLIVVFVVSGFYRVPADQRAVVVGLASTPTVKPTGLHWHNALLSRVVLVPDGDARNYRQTSDFLTQDNNLVNVGAEITYHVNAPADYALAAASPLAVMQNQLVAGLRGLVARQPLAELTEGGQSALADALKDALTQQLATWQSGIRIDEVEITRVGTAAELEPALAALRSAQSQAEKAEQKATDDGETQQLEAEGQAQALLIDAKGYSRQVVEKAEGEVSRFETALSAYRKAPKITRDRLYLETLEALFAGTSKVLVMGANQNVLSVPVADILAQHAASSHTEKDASATSEKSQSSSSAVTVPEKTDAIPSLYGTSSKGESK